MKVHLDFETFSPVDLKRSGIHVYAASPDTKVLCLAWAIDGGMVQTWVRGDVFPAALAAAIEQGADVVAHNFVFEYLIWNSVLIRHVMARTGVKLPPLKFEQGARDTMLRAWSFGLPGDLGGACLALGAPPAMRKSRDGHLLMMKLCKPGKDGAQPQGDFQALARYCVQDVVAEMWLDGMLPVLGSREKDFRITDFHMNAKGLGLDVFRVGLLSGWSARLKPLMDKSMAHLTSGGVRKTTEVKKITEWLQARGVGLETLAKVRLEDALADGELDGDVTAREVVELRLLAARSSVSKLNSMWSCCGLENRVRGVFQLLGAGRTGRYAGRLIQPQNFPRGTLGRESVEVEIEKVGVGLREPSMAMVSSALRSCIRAAKDHTLVSVDFSAIEARVLAWLSGNKRVVDLFRAGEDVYAAEARAQGSSDRRFGKVMVLGLGYGMGGAKFQETAKLQAGLRISLISATEAVHGWRQTNWQVVDLWRTLESEFRVALAGGYAGKRFEFHRTRRVMEFKLPSGRSLWYQNPRVEAGELVHDGVDSFTRKWGRIKTYGGKLAENCVQALARDILMEFMERLRAMGVKLVGSVHDEVIAECGESFGQRVLDAAVALARDLEHQVSWMRGLPLDASGWFGERYGK